MIVRKLKKEFLDRSVMPEEVQALVASAFEKGAFAMAQEVLTNADNTRELDKFLGKIETEVEFYLEENLCGIFVPIQESNKPESAMSGTSVWFLPSLQWCNKEVIGVKKSGEPVRGILKRYTDDSGFFINSTEPGEIDLNVADIVKICKVKDYYKEPSPKAVFADDPMWFEPHNGKVGEKYVGLTGYNSTLQGTLKIQHIGGDTDYYYLIDRDGREWGVTKIATVEGFNKASNADDLWFLPSLAYAGQEVVGLTPSGQNVFGAKLFQSDGIWYVKGENEMVGLDVIRIAIPEVYKKMQEIKDAKDLRDEK